MKTKLIITQAQCPHCQQLVPVTNGRIEEHGNCSAAAVDGDASWSRIGTAVRDNSRWITGRDK